MRTRSFFLPGYSLRFGGDYFLFSQLIPKRLAELLHFGMDHREAIRLIRILNEVILVVSFRFVKCRQRRDFRHNGIGPQVRCVCFGHGLFGDFALPVIMAKNHRSILRAHVMPLPIQGRGIVRVPENEQDFRKRNRGWIKLDLHHLGVPGAARTHLMIRRMLNRSPRVSGDDAMHADHIAINRLHTPEAPAAKRCDFH